VEAAKIAALIYRAQCGIDDSQLHRIHEILPRLVPEDLLAVQKVEDWRKQITHVYNGQVQLTESEAKLEFLKIIHEFPTFGSTFFVAKQATDSNLQETILIAINRHGFNIIHPVTKVSDTLASNTTSLHLIFFHLQNILVAYKYSDLSYWSSGNTYFQIRFGNMMGSTKLLCETTQGYKMDELLSSYTRYLNTLVKNDDRRS
jgi:myosin VIIa